MNNDQIMSLVRNVLPFVGALLAERGIIPSDALNSIEAAFLAFLGAALTLGSIIWGLWVQSHSSKIAAVNAIPGVKVVSQSASAPMVTTAPKAS